MPEQPYKSVIEALLLVAEEPLTPEKISQVVEISKEEVAGLLNELREEYERHSRGIRLYEADEGYKLGTPPELSAYIEKLFSVGASPTLSRAALETLAIIAYRQPITRVEIDAIRGVKGAGVVDTLLKRKLIQVVGRKESPGRPQLYGTTPEFLKYFGLNDIHELPPLEKLQDKE